MDVIRTPDERFAGLPGFPFSPNYVEVPSGNGGTLRVHYLDEGPRDAPVVLLMHGEPSWSFLYRTMIPVLTAAGLRGRARPRRLRPLRQADGAHRLHVRRARRMDAVGAFRRARPARCDIRRSGLGRSRRAAVGRRTSRALRARRRGEHLPADRGHTARRRVPRVAAFLPDRRRLPRGLHRQHRVHDRSRRRRGRRYDAPFPDEQYKAGARQFPMLVPTSPDDPAAAANRARGTCCVRSTGRS